MSEKEKEVMKTLGQEIPKMTDLQKARLIGYGEGLAAREDRGQEESEASEQF